MREREAHRDLVRLVRHVIGGRSATGDSVAPSCGGTCGVTRQAGLDARVTRADGVAKFFPESIIGRAVSLGLLTEEAGQELRALPAAATFVKRALSAPEEGFGAQHRTMAEAVVETSGGRQAVQRNLAESPLAIVARLREKSGKSYLPREAIEAGERLHRDFTRAQLQPRMTMSYEPRLAARTQGGGGGELADSAIAARGRVASAMEAVGPELCGVAIDVCGFEKGLETVERERQWPARSAKLMLRAALMALARHYAPPPPRGRRAHSWGGEGYRPEIDGGTKRSG